MIQRQHFNLTAPERERFDMLRPIPGDAFAFWRQVAQARGLDPGSIIGIPNGTFTALPLGHNKHWCFPFPLVCRNRPDVGS